MNAVSAIGPFLSRKVAESSLVTVTFLHNVSALSPFGDFNSGYLAVITVGFVFSPALRIDRREKGDREESRPWV